MPGMSNCLSPFSSPGGHKEYGHGEYSPIPAFRLPGFTPPAPALFHFTHRTYALTDVFRQELLGAFEAFAELRLTRAVRFRFKFGAPWHDLEKFSPRCSFRASIVPLLITLEATDVIVMAGSNEGVYSSLSSVCQPFNGAVGKGLNRDDAGLKIGKGGGEETNAS